MSKGAREVIADWLMALAAPVLLISLFLTWSHQFSRPFIARFGPTAALQGIPRDPSAWQVYSIADVLLALVAGGLMAVALWGGRGRRLALTLALAVAIPFTIHALGAPPTNGALLYDPSAGPAYVASGATSGAGEVMALVALALGGAGVAFSFTLDDF